jgi:hypothetical protein
MPANRSSIRRWIGCAAATAALIAGADAARADESGVSFWLPGQFGSLAAVPGVPGWSLGAVYYHTSLDASGSAAAAREIQVSRFPATVNVNLNVNLKAQGDLMLLAPTYAFATPVLGGQLAMGITGIFGRSSADINGTLTGTAGPFTATRMGSIGDSITSVGDLYPMVSLKWNNGVNNYMTYATGDIPVGAYDPNSVANLGLGHGAIDTGGGYTYFNPATGYEFSGVAGFTYNFKNTDTQYQSGVDFTSTGARPGFFQSRFSSALSTGHRRQWAEPDPRRIPVARSGNRTPNWIPLSGRQYAGISESEGIWRIRCGQPAVGLERLADIPNLAGGTQQHGDANPAPGDEITR